MARRRNSITHRFARMRGLSAEEKSLMMRLGNLMDAALNNRQSSNPFEPSKNKRDRVLYPPTGLVVATGNKAVTLTWNAANSDIHLRYEIEILNKDTGVSVTRSSYTNTYRFKGVNGSYSAKIKSVGRNASSSEIQEIDFILIAQFMQLEGAKNGPTVLGTMVQDHIQLLEGYSLYFWGSVILDKYAAGTRNNEVIFKLWSMAGADAVYDASTATLEQTIVLYPATESGADLDGNARGGSITRPASISGRDGSFETTQSVMFNPRSVTTAEEDTIYTFFLQAVNREIEDDEVNLSLTIWAGFDGVGDHIPPDPWDGGDADYKGTDHKNSLWVHHLRARGDVQFPIQADGRTAWGYTDAGLGGIGNTWTFACWFRQRRKNVLIQTDYDAEDSTDPENSANIPSTKTIFHRRTKALTPNNEILISTSSGPSGGNYFHDLLVRIGAASGSVESDPPSARTAVEFSLESRVTNNTSGTSQIYPWQEGSAQRNDGWTFIVVCFDGGPIEDTDAVPKIRVYLNNRPTDAHASSTDPPLFHIRGMNNQEEVTANGQNGLDMVGFIKSRLRTDGITQDDSDAFVYSFGTLVNEVVANNGKTRGSGAIPSGSDLYFHMAGFWNICLDIDSPPGAGDGVNSSRMKKPQYGPWGRVDSLVNGFPYPGEGHEPNPKFDWSYTYKFGDLFGEQIPSAQPHIGEPGLYAINYLYNGGHGSDIDWKVNADDYPFAENLIHHWQFGAIEDPFTLEGDVLRDTGHYIYGGDINLLTTMPLPLDEDGSTGHPVIQFVDIFPQTVYEWRTGGVSADTPTYDSDLMANNGGGPDQLSWTEFVNIEDVQSPDGDNGTTENDRSYPGSRL